MIWTSNAYWIKNNSQNGKGYSQREVFEIGAMALESLIQQELRLITLGMVLMREKVLRDLIKRNEREESEI